MPTLCHIHAGDARPQFMDQRGGQDQQEVHKTEIQVFTKKLLKKEEQSITKWLEENIPSTLVKH